MKKYLILLAVLTLLLVGCTSTADMIYDNGEGQVTVDYDTSNADMDSWCAAGAEWSGDYQATAGVGQDVSAEWMIQGLVEEGDLAGFCHVVYTMETDEGVISMEYYFNEDESEAYIEMVSPDGSTFTQKITA